MFKKYPSIENSYRMGFVQKALTMYPELETCKYVIQEKIHGSNFQIIISKDDSVSYGKRTSSLQPTEKFYEYQSVVSKSSIQNLITEIKKTCPYTNLTNTHITLYGELFGANIQKGISYGQERKILFYDISIDGSLMAPIVLYDLFNLIDAKEYIVPTLDIVSGLKDAMEYNIEFNSKAGINNGISTDEENICEGVVIKPYEKIYFLRGNNLFYLKKKNSKFAEKQREPKNKVTFGGPIQELRRKFFGYCNENRVNSVFSKEGIIQEQKDIGKYIKLVVEDAKVDFEIDFSDQLKDIDTNQLKRIYNAGAVIVQYLNKYL